ncbi:MAG: DmsE family decaheme c-type cytochrome [Burkholderiales bacterium]|nr:DmsE family decaheme c-type cytochrome [Burkholderiales bacterium]
MLRRLAAGAAAVALLACGSIAAAQPQQAAGGAEAKKDQPKDLVLRGDAKCTRCHDETEEFPVVAIAKTPHGVTADRRTPTCTSCHGESDAHVNRPPDSKVRPKPDRMFGKHSQTPAEDQSGACLTCHQRGGTHMNWAGSAHDRARVACSSCHVAHAERDQVTVKQTQAGVCFDCHKDQRAAMFRYSSHPLRSGSMACSSCHQPHGSVSDFSLVRNTVNETCYTCHADKRGPFLWEHPPARENCGECHNPHGSNVPQMLKARGPYLCQQCHVAPQHPSSLYSGSNLPPNLAGDKMLGQQCANCHSKVHGSNHPSGARLTR